MGKKLTVAMLSVACLFAGAAGFAACDADNNPANEDKASNNAEFVEYRKKVISVLQDNGFNVNDPDSNKNSAVSAQVVSDKDNASQISDIVMNGGQLIEDFDQVKNERDSIFEQSLSISLIIGDAISNYYNETELYGIGVYFEMWNQYFDVIADGDTDIVRCYTPAGDNNAASSLTMSLTYRNKTDYEFTCIQVCGDESIYAYGNSQKEYVQIMNLTGEGQSTVFYSPKNGKGFVSTSQTTVAQCYGLVKAEVESMDQTGIAAIKDNIKYNVTEEQGTEVIKKYFGSSERVEDRGLIYSEVEGIKYGYFYSAYDESVITIPSDCEYLAEDFFIIDNTDSVERVIIPASVKGIVCFVDRDTGEAFDKPKILSADDMVNPDNFLRIDCESYENNFKTIKEITVESGSPLFKEGNGNLYTVNNTLLYLADKSIGTVFAPADYDKRILMRIAEFGSSYKNLFGEVTDLNITVPYEDNGALYLTSRMPALKNINVTGSFAEEQIQETPFEIEIEKDVTLNIDVAGWRECWAGSRFYFIPRDKNGAHITVNITGDCPIPHITCESSEIKNQTIKLSVSKRSYEMKFGALYEEDFANYVYAEDELSDLEIVGRDEEYVQLKLSESYYANKIIVPRIFNGLKVSYFEFNLEHVQSKPLTLTLPEDIEISMIIPPELYGNAYLFNYDQFVLNYSGTFNGLREKFERYFTQFNEYEWLDITINVQCSDKNGVLQFGFEYNPDTYSVTVTYGDITVVYKVPKRTEGTGIVILSDKLEISSDRVYFYIDEAGNVGNAFDGSGCIINAPLTRDSSFKLFSRESGFADYKLESPDQSYSLDVKVCYSEHLPAVVTGGTVLGKNIALSPCFWKGENGEEEIQGVICGLFSEFTLPLENDNDIMNVWVKLVLDGDGELKFVFCDKVRYDVTITLCDGSTLNQTVYLGDKIRIDAAEWKLQDNCGYYVEWRDGDKEGCENVVPDVGYLDILAEELTLRKVVSGQSVPFELQSDDYNLSGTVYVTKEGITLDITGTLMGADVSESVYGRVDLWQQPCGDVVIDEIRDYNNSWLDVVIWTLQTQIDADGIISVTGLDVQRQTGLNYMDSAVNWSASIRVKDGKTTAEINYYAMLDKDGFPVDEYREVTVEVRDFTDDDRANAVEIVREDLDENGNIVYEKVLICLQTEVTDSGISFGYLSFIKETVQ